MLAPDSSTVWFNLGVSPKQMCLPFESQRWLFCPRAICKTNKFNFRLAQFAMMRCLHLGACLLMVLFSGVLNTGTGDNHLIFLEGALPSKSRLEARSRYFEDSNLYAKRWQRREPQTLTVLKKHGVTRAIEFPPQLSQVV